MTNYSVFISFKNTFDGKPTVDADIAKKLYDTLTKKGVATFYSNDTIKSLGASEYKQVINDALDSSAVLILIGSRLEHIKKDTAQWVHYEWGNFHSECMYSNGSKILVPYLSDAIARKDKPFELREIQTFTIENDSVDDVVEFVMNFLNAQRGEKAKSTLAEQITTDKSTKSATSKASAEAKPKVTDEAPIERVTEVVPPVDKVEKTRKRAKIANWINLPILSFIILACCITLLICYNEMGSEFFLSWFLILMAFTFACYPFACVLIHFARKLKVLPKVLLGVFITLMCLPLVGISTWIVFIDYEWSVYVIISTVFVAPNVSIVMSIAYSIIVLLKIHKFEGSDLSI